MLESGIKASVFSYSTVIHACTRAADVDKAETCMVDMRNAGIIASTVAYSSVVQAIAKAGELPRAEKWLQRMVAAGLSQMLLP